MRNHLERSPRIIGEVCVAPFAMYIDDSGTSPDQAIAVAAGFIAPLKAWIEFENEWNAARAIPGDEFKCMHMVDFVSGINKKSEFLNWSDLSKKQRILQRLRGIIKHSCLKAFALGVVKKDFELIVPPSLRLQGFENHYVYAIRRVLGMIAGWRQDNMAGEPIEYYFDWQEKGDSVRKEIEKVFSAAEGQDDAFKLFGLKKCGYGFREKESVLPLQAADIFAWTIYQAMLNEIEKKKVTLLAQETFQDFYLHNNRNFMEGGYNKPHELREWVKSKGLEPF